MVTKCSLILFFCMWLSNFPSTTYWRSFLFCTVCFWFLYQKLFVHIHVVLFLGSQFCSIGLCVWFSASTMLFWLLFLCSIIWRQVVWSLQLCFFLRIILAIWDLLWFHINLMLFCLIFVYKCHWNFDGDCIKSVHCFR